MHQHHEAAIVTQRMRNNISTGALPYSHACPPPPLKATHLVQGRGPQLGQHLVAHRMRYTPVLGTLLRRQPHRYEPRHTAQGCSRHQTAHQLLQGGGAVAEQGLQGSTRQGCQWCLPSRGVCLAGTGFSWYLSYDAMRLHVGSCSDATATPCLSWLNRGIMAHRRQHTAKACHLPCCHAVS